MTTLTMEECVSLHEQNYVVFQYHWVQFITEHLADVSRVFEGDMQLVVILAVVGQQQLGRTMSGKLSGEGDDVPVFPINASRLADVTGIPRETVRRKLMKLEELGWIERRGASWAMVVRGGILNAAARIDLADLDRRGMRRAAGFAIGYVQLAERYRAQQS